MRSYMLTLQHIVGLIAAMHAATQDWHGVVICLCLMVLFPIRGETPIYEEPPA